MRALIQRVGQASVSVSEEIIAQIDNGLLVLLGIEEEDNDVDINWLVGKVIGLRIFEDQEGKMNLNLSDTGGKLLVISQFTLHASTKKGNRPSFIKAAKPEQAIELYEAFIKRAELEIGEEIQSGQFGANMHVSLVNDGPVTIWIDSKNKE
jgi:D-tyrosyl-tRNA(Tyr) deacylase